jgi:hypothetical protein
MIRTVVYSAAQSATNDGEQWKETQIIRSLFRPPQTPREAVWRRQKHIRLGKGVLPAQASPLCLDPGAASESGTVSPNLTREILTCDLSPIAFNFGRA